MEHEGFPLALEAEQKQLWGAGRGARGTPVGSQDNKREEIANEVAISKDPGGQPCQLFPAPLNSAQFTFLANKGGGAVHVHLAFPLSVRLPAHNPLYIIYIT